MLDQHRANIPKNPKKIRGNWPDAAASELSKTKKSGKS
jgi:hypothetical protein